ncbi:hypothetical protein C8E03_1432 [Lachnotalea glycerini]|uniref:Uncharacterized protein n=1 Tax=Lachnotalea glycerini TaxID=1763509 RepID=A0A318EQF2_9FIRM|nr:hypothetical protein [Lachnotalea glycerini]PXV83877.1 hypothetical protein C8E03_1432 [Lachnotalea glycerini]
MSYEINVIVVNQKEAVKYTKKSSIILQNEKDNSEEMKRYFEIWPYFSQTPGILYTLVQEMEEDYFSSFPICDSIFDRNEDELSLPYWIDNTEIIENLTPLLIKQNVMSEFVEIIRFLVESSPIKTIMFHTRYQGGDYEIICGVINIEEFFSMLQNEKILFNVCYIIRKD